MKFSVRIKEEKVNINMMKEFEVNTWSPHMNIYTITCAHTGTHAHK